MEKLYLGLARWLIKNTNGSEKEYEIYKYGFQSAIEQLVFISSCVAIALSLNSIRTMLLFLLVFYLLRPYVGGFHFKQFWKCYMMSVAIAIIIVEIPSLKQKELSIAFCAILIFLVVLYLLLFKYQNYNVDDIFYRKKITINIMVILVMSLIFYLLEWEIGLSVILYSIIMVILSRYLASLCNVVSEKLLHFKK